MFFFSFTLHFQILLCCGMKCLCKSFLVWLRLGIIVSKTLWLKKDKWVTQFTQPEQRQRQDSNSSLLASTSARFRYCWWFSGKWAAMSHQTVTLRNTCYSTQVEFGDKMGRDVGAENLKKKANLHLLWMKSEQRILHVIFQIILLIGEGVFRPKQSGKKTA